jgi:hypothetical protein
MKYKEFLQYLEANLDAYKVFMNSVMQYQREKNAKRQPSKRWDEDKMQKAAYDMWKKSMENLYNTLKREISSDIELIWLDYMEKNGIMESLNDGIRDMDFTSEG